MTTPLQEFEVADFTTTKNVEHELPKFGREHDISMEQMCWCCPMVRELRDGSFLIIHSAEH